MGLDIIIFKEWRKTENRYVPLNTSMDVLREGGTAPDWIYPLSISFDSLENIYAILEEVGLEPKKMLPKLADFQKGGPEVVYAPLQCHTLFVEKSPEIKKVMNWTKQDEDYFKGGTPGKTYPTSPGETPQQMDKKVGTWRLLYTLDSRWKEGRWVCYDY